MMGVARLFYRFAGIHSLLIGLLPFFIPVLLWQQDYRLTEVSAFIALTGVGFMIALMGWKALYDRRYWRAILIGSFIAELALVASLILATLLIERSMTLFILAALLNGIYNCFYWITQRTLFSAMTQSQTGNQTENKTGKQFGNFQIVIVIFLKIGILMGGYFLAQQQTLWLLLISTLLSVAAYYGLCKQAKYNESQLTPIDNAAIIDWRQKLVFTIDGVFLFCESYFWVLTLFFITNNNVMDLGLLVVGLTITLSIIFWGIKNTIDKLNQRYVFYSAIVLYALSWVIRSSITNHTEHYVLLASIIVIAFLTTFFRLSFNKQFFDDANAQQPLAFIIKKSYLSQRGLVVFFSLLSLALIMMGESDNTLALFYWCLAPIAVLYGMYPLRHQTHLQSELNNE